MNSAPQLLERTSGYYRATLTDADGVTLVGASALTTLLLSLYDQKTGTFINGRNVQDCKAASGVALHGVTVWDALQNAVDQNGVAYTYNLQLELAPLDNIIITDTLPVETHIALWKLTWLAGARGANYQVALPVTNLRLVP